jgi:hypothetical protein
MTRNHSNTIPMEEVKEMSDRKGKKEEGEKGGRREEDESREQGLGVWPD